MLTSQLRWHLDELNGDSVGSEAIVNRLMELSRVAALAEMASGIAHELNQPLGAIATFSQAGDRLLNRPEPMVSRARDVFQQINTEALNAGDGIRRIRSLFDHAEPMRIKCQMSDLVGELVPALQALACAANISLKVDVQSRLPQVSADRLRIQLVLFRWCKTRSKPAHKILGLTYSSTCEPTATRSKPASPILGRGSPRISPARCFDRFLRQNQAEPVWVWPPAVRRLKPTRVPSALIRRSPAAADSGFVYRSCRLEESSHGSSR